jgi:hypothetical protein
MRNAGSLSRNQRANNFWIPWSLALRAPRNDLKMRIQKARQLLHPIKRGFPMKLILTLLGVVLLIVAAVYFLVPADQLPGFFPGHETVARMHYKHGIVAGVVGIVLLAAGVWIGRR